MKKITNILLLSALALTFNSNNLKAAKKKGATIEIINQSGHELTFLKFDIRRPCRIGAANDFVLGKPLKRHGASAKGSNQYLKNKTFPTIDPQNIDAIPRIQIKERHNGKEIHKIKIRYNKAGVGFTDYQTKFPCGLIIQENSTIRVTVYPHSISVGVIGKVEELK